MASDIPSAESEFRSYFNRGIFYHNTANLQEAKKHLERALSIARHNRDKGNIPWKEHEWRCICNIGTVADTSGDYAEALRHYNDSLKISLEIGSKFGECTSRASLGNTLVHMGDLEEGKKQIKQALWIISENKDQIRDQVLEANCYGNLGQASFMQGDFNSAKNYYDKAIELGENIDSPLIGDYYISIGSLHGFLGNIDNAKEFLKKAINIAKKSNDELTYKLTVCRAHANLAHACYLEGNLDMAINYYKESLKIARDIFDKHQEAKSLANLGFVQLMTLEVEEAFRCFSDALKISQDINDDYQEANCYINLGLAYVFYKDYKNAESVLKKSREISKRIPSIDLERTALFQLGLLYRDQKRFQEAFDHLKESVDLGDLMYHRLVEIEHKLGILLPLSSIYDHILSIAITLGKYKEAFYYAERAKSRVFLDMMASAIEVKPSVPIANDLQLLLDNETRHIERLRQIETQYLRNEKIKIEPGEAEQLRTELDNIYNAIEQYDPQYVYVRRARPLSLDRIQQILAKSRRRLILVEYFVTEEKTFIFAITKDNFYIKEVQLSRSALKDYVFKEQINDKKEVMFYPKHPYTDSSWLDLSKHLLGPISEHILESDTICFVPHGLLHYLPLHVLYLGNQPLIIHRPVVYSPSASLLQFHEERTPNSLRTCSAFAIQEAQQGYLFSDEAREVSELFDSSFIVDGDKKQIFENASGKDIVHFATHGVFDDKDPLASGIMLKNKEILTAREIFNLKERWNVDLVTLSACETGWNKIKAGDELIGLTRALLYAGARSVVVSLWAVYDNPTIELMIQFYSILKGGIGDDGAPVDKAEALQMAQIKIREKYPDPLDWAPFILVGDWQ